ncbi:MAG: hypothetical protein PVG99_00125 [Desulfobacteraceae bacterium]|jgi:hypothetical protein
MNDNFDERNGSLASLLLSLHCNDMTGIVTLQDAGHTLKFYLKGGRIVYAEGIDKESQLLQEIASKKALDPERLKALKRLREKDPQSFGKALIKRKLISESAWRKFLEIKVKTILAAALRMDTPDVSFSQSELGVLPVNFIDRDMIQLLLATIRGMKGAAHFKKAIPGDDAIFLCCPEAGGLKPDIPLTTSEKAILSSIDGEKTVKEIVNASGLTPGIVYRSLYILICFGLAEISSLSHPKDENQIHYVEIINLYLGLLNIIAARFRKHIGKRFHNTFRKCKAQLTGKSKALLHDLDLPTRNDRVTAKDISKRFAEQYRRADGRLVLYASFNKLLYLLIMSMKKVLGKALAEKTIGDMMNMLHAIENHHKDTETINYVMANLGDYLRQIKL